MTCQGWRRTIRRTQELPSVDQLQLMKSFELAMDNRCPQHDPMSTVHVTRTCMPLFPVQSIHLVFKIYLCFVVDLLKPSYMYAVSCGLSFVAPPLPASHTPPILTAFRFPHLMYLSRSFCNVPSFLVCCNGRSYSFLC